MGIFYEDLAITFKQKQGCTAITFMLDRQKGLILELSQVFPLANNRYCFRYIYKNYSQRFKGIRGEFDVGQYHHSR